MLGDSLFTSIYTGYINPIGTLFLVGLFQGFLGFLTQTTDISIPIWVGISGFHLSQFGTSKSQG